LMKGFWLGRAMFCFAVLFLLHYADIFDCFRVNKQFDP